MNVASPEIAETVVVPVSAAVPTVSLRSNVTGPLNAVALAPLASLTSTTIAGDNVSPRYDVAAAETKDNPTG